MLRLVYSDRWEPDAPNTQKATKKAYGEDFHRYSDFNVCFLDSIDQKQMDMLIETTEDLKEELEVLTGLENALETCPATWSGKGSGEARILLTNPEMPKIGWRVPGIPFYAHVGFDVIYKRTTLSPQVRNVHFQNYHIGPSNDSEFSAAIADFSQPLGYLRVEQEFLEAATQLLIPQEIASAMAPYAMQKIISDIPKNRDVAVFLYRALDSHFDMLGRERVARLYDEDTRKIILR